MIFLIQQHVVKDFCDRIIWMKKRYYIDLISRYTYAFYIFNYDWKYLWEENTLRIFPMGDELFQQLCNKNAPRNRSIFEENFCPSNSGGIYNE